MNKINMQAMHTAFHLKQAHTAARMMQANIVTALGSADSQHYVDLIAQLMDLLNTDLAKLDNITLTTGNTP